MIDVLLSAGISIATGGGLYALGAWRGRSAERARAKRPICGCGHHFALHSPESGCRDKNYEVLNSREVMTECGCQKYVGPEPLGNEYYAQEITG